jgi:hypothetical protein
VFEIDEFLIPRDRKLDGSSLAIVSAEGSRRVVITDGERSAVYRPLGRALRRAPVRIVRHDTEAGPLCEANVVRLSDGDEEADYVPLDVWPTLG